MEVYTYALYPISDDEIINIEIPTGKPLVYELDKALKPVNSYYLTLVGELFNL